VGTVAIAFLASLCASVSIHGTERAKTLEQPSSSIIAITLPLQTEQLEHNLFVAAYQFTNLANGVRHHCSARLNTPQFVMKCCSAYFSLLNLSCTS
jgi:hypothetical protein